MYNEHVGYMSERSPRLPLVKPLYSDKTQLLPFITPDRSMLAQSYVFTNLCEVSALLSQLPVIY